MKDTNLEIGMLTYDWASDPIYFGSSEKQDKIKQAQRLALERIGRGAYPVSELRDFLVNTGIYQDVLNSVSELPVQATH